MTNEPARCWRYSGKNQSQQRRPRENHRDANSAPEASGSKGTGSATVRGWRALAAGECGHGMPCPYCGKGKDEKEGSRDVRQAEASDAAVRWRRLKPTLLKG
jgi:hypothetical protein